jgi:hypothetical protein
MVYIFQKISKKIWERGIAAQSWRNRNVIAAQSGRNPGAIVAQVWLRAGAFEPGTCPNFFRLVSLPAANPLNLRELRGHRQGLVSLRGRLVSLPLPIFRDHLRRTILPARTIPAAPAGSLRNPAGHRFPARADRSR